MPSNPTEEQRLRYNAKINAKYHRRQKWIGLYKVLKGCDLCGYNKHPFALDFDHIDPSAKSFLIPQNINRKLTTLMAEIRKCRVLCANCHRLVSFTKP